MSIRRAGALLFSFLVFLGVPDVLAQQAAVPGLARRADGRPDLGGLWQALNTAAWNLEPHLADAGGPAGVGVVEGGTIPYTAAALEIRNRNAQNRAALDPEAKCYLPGLPRAMYMPFPFQIVQTESQISMLFEYAHALRNIRLNSPHPPPGIEWYMGDSRGRWDGDTLVVDVDHFNADSWFDKAGNFHSEDMHLVERFTPLSPDHLRYEVTVEDPKTFTRPWKMSLVLYRIKDTGARLLEYECFAFDGPSIYRALIPR